MTGAEPMLDAPGAALTEDDLLAWSKDRIAGFKRPRSVRLRTEPISVTAQGV